MKLYHGTSYNNAMAILKEGFSVSKGEKVWTVSENGVYFWSPDELAKIGECESEWANEHAKNMAYGNAQCAVATERGDCRCVVFEVEIDEASLEIYPDRSCPNMGGAVVIFENIPPEKITRKWISPDLSLIRGCLIDLVRNKDLYAGYFTDIEEKVADLLSKEYIDIDEEFPLEEFA